MFSLQSNNQALFYLSQITSAVTPRRAPFNYAQSRKQNDGDVWCSQSLDEVVNNLRETAQDGPFAELSACAWERWERLTAQSGRRGRKRRSPLADWLLETDLSGQVALTSPRRNISIMAGSPMELVRHALLTPEKPYPFKVSVRGFKTERSLTAELSRSPGMFERLRRAVGLDSSARPTTAPIPETDTHSLKGLLATDGVSTEEAQRIKIAFAEGYTAGQGTNRPGRSARWLKVLQQLLTIILFLSIFVSLMASANGSMFRIQLGNQVEVDPEEIHVTFNDVKGADEAKQELKNKNKTKAPRLDSHLPVGNLMDTSLSW